MMIEVGKEQWQRVIDALYKPFSKKWLRLKKKWKIQIKDEPAGFDCKCVAVQWSLNLVVLVSSMLVAISQIAVIQAIVKEIGVECPSCHQGQIIERKTKRNRLFYGCNRYPECEFTSWDKPVGRDCPKCGNFLMEKKSPWWWQAGCM